MVLGWICCISVISVLPYLTSGQQKPPPVSKPSPVAGPNSPLAKSTVGQSPEVLAALNQQQYQVRGALNQQQYQGGAALNQDPAWYAAWNPQGAALNSQPPGAAWNPQLQAAAWNQQGAAWNPHLQAVAWNQQGAALNPQIPGAPFNPQGAALNPQIPGAALYPEQLVGTKDASLDALLGTASPASGKTSVPNKATGGTTIPNKAAPPPPPAVPNKAPDSPPVHPNVPFLLDPSPLNLPQEECITSDGEVGECHSPLDCGYTNGVINGLCHQGMDISAHARVCCIYPSYCGFETNREVTYFRNPDYPRTSNNTGECHFRVRLLPGVCQLRLDFVEFSLKPLVQGECAKDNRLTVSSPLQRTFVPVGEFCGKLHDDKQDDPVRTDLNHLYIHVDEIPWDVKVKETPNSPEPTVDLRVHVNNYPSRWNIRIAQVQCDGAPLQAPSGCSQYYNSVNGTIRSFNREDKTYHKDMKVSACIRMDPSACALRYVIKDMQLGDVKNKKEGKTQLGYGLTCQDYVSFNGMQSGICGSAFNKEIIVPLNGPQGLTMVSDDVNLSGSDLGFRINYNFIHKCDNNTEYFKFPVPK